MVLEPSKEKEAEAVFRKWELDFAVCGETTDDLRFRIIWQGKEVANLPIKELGDEAPEYDRPWVEPKKAPGLPADAIPAVNDVGAALVRLIGAPDQASRAWVYEQYDCLVQGNSAQIPGGDAGVVRVEGTSKALAMSADVTPRYCDADPFEGGKQAVAESWRNVTAVGGDPIALTDNLNFGNPEKPEAMGQFVRALQGIADACVALNFPIVSGNVSLYNETNGEGILPSPTIVGVGLLPDVTKMATIAFKADGDEVLLIGGHGSHLGQSVYLRDLHGREEGTPPPVDLALEKKNGDFVRGLITSGRVSTCHDLSDGGPRPRLGGNGAGRKARRPHRAWFPHPACGCLRRGSGPLPDRREAGRKRRHPGRSRQGRRQRRPHWHGWWRCRRLRQRRQGDDCRSPRLV